MTELLSWSRSILCFLCFFQVFLRLAPKKSDQKYLKFFGNLVLVMLLLRPFFSVFGKTESLEELLKIQTIRKEYSELKVHMEGMEELKTTLVETAFRREVERQIRKIPEELGFSVLSLTVSYSDFGEPEAMDLKLLGKAEETDRVRKALSGIYGLPDEKLSITVKEA